MITRDQWARAKQLGVISWMDELTTPQRQEYAREDIQEYIAYRMEARRRVKAMIADGDCGWWHPEEERRFQELLTLWKEIENG